ncbi:MAG: D-ribose ABC transporter substrate-binding protein [Bacillota bacterium]|nr:D-ribose ABC transporter substrate-binding protein [Bacillota bacterium]
MRRNRTGIWVALLLAGTLALAACGGGQAPANQQGSSSSSNAGGSGSSGTKAKVTIALAVSTLNNPYFVTLRDGAQKEADTRGAQLIVYDAQNDLAKQTSQIEDAITKKVDALIVNPVDSSGIVPAVEEANKAGVPVIAVDRGVAGGKLAAFIASDNVEAGKLASEALFKALGGKGKVALLMGVPGASATNDRTRGFEQALGQYGGIQVVARQTANFDRAQGLSVMENLLQAHPDLNGVFAENDEMALGAIQALKSAGKNGKVLVTAIDGTPDGVAAVKAGDLLVTVAQQPSWMGSKAVEYAVDLKAGRSVPSGFTPAPLTVIDKAHAGQ